VGEDIVISIAGNKLDLERQRVVTKQEAADYAASVGAQYAETSAKNGRGIEDAFGGMARRLLASPKVATRMNGSVSGGMIVDDAVESRRGGCC
jgi:Ras-related protein Rab-21